MVIRLWKGQTLMARSHDYLAYVSEVVFPKLLRIQGYLGGRVLQRQVGNHIEFLVETRWASWDAIRAFAGERPECAVVEPAAKDMLSHFDEYVVHFNLVHDSGPGEGRMFER